MISTSNLINQRWYRKRIRLQLFHNCSLLIFSHYASELIWLRAVLTVTWVRKCLTEKLFLSIERLCYVYFGDFFFFNFKCICNGYYKMIYGFQNNHKSNFILYNWYLFAYLTLAFFYWRKHISSDCYYIFFTRYFNLSLSDWFLVKSNI